MPLHIAIHGAAGRMGQRLLTLGREDADVEIVAALEGPDHPRLGEDAGQVAHLEPFGLPLSSDLPTTTEVVIDFSVPAAAAAIARRCARLAIPLVLATTGLDTTEEADIDAAARVVPVVWAPSMSPAVNVAMRLTQIAAGALRGHATGVDVEIIERHHRFKEERAQRYRVAIRRNHHGATGTCRGRPWARGRTGPRTASEIGFHAVRGGDNPGEHTIVFGMLGETLEITVKASNRDCYALGGAGSRQVCGSPATRTVFHVGCPGSR